jgi:hypothetical protein
LLGPEPLGSDHLVDDAVEAAQDFRAFPLSERPGRYSVVAGIGAR